MVFLNKFNEVVHEHTLPGSNSNLTGELVSDLNSKVDSLNVSSIFCNELYLFFYIMMKEWNCEVKGVNKDKIVAKTKSKFKCFWLCLLKNNFGIKSSYYCQLIFVSFPILVLSLFSFTALVVLMPFYLLAKYFFCERKYSLNSRRVCIVRSQATFSKVIRYCEKHDVKLISEDMFYKNKSLDSLFSFLTFKDIIKTSILFPYTLAKDCFSLFSDVGKLFDKNCLGFVFSYYIVRLPFSSLSRLLYGAFFSKFDLTEIITGNKEDRYALIESESAECLGIKLICLPHGLEYGFKLPVELVGDVFYVSSSYSASYLNDLYRESKFVFDESVIKDMFDKKVSNKADSKIVFFTEARELNVNLDIIRTLQSLNYDFLVKLHPKDKADNYSSLKYPVEFVDSFNSAITGNLCLARRSTILLESIYNQSIPCAVLISKKDAYYVNSVFPSLSDPLISKVYNFSDLDRFLLCKGFVSNVR